MSASLQRRERPREAVCPVSVSYCPAQPGDPSLEIQILPEACSAPGDKPRPLPQKVDVLVPRQAGRTKGP